MIRLPGDADILINGERHRLRLTLGALAHMEAEIGGGDFEKLRERLKRPSASDLLLVLHALLAGGGTRIALDILKASDVDFAAAAAAIGEAFRALADERGDYAPGPAAGVEMSPTPRFLEEEGDGAGRGKPGRRRKAASQPLSSPR
jgi:hypothetical protein